MKASKYILVASAVLALVGCSSDDAPDGASLYSTNCASCHGADATGAAPSNDKNIVGASASKINAAIGGGVADMSALSALSSAEIDAIVEHLASLRTSGKLENADVLTVTASATQVTLKDNNGQTIVAESESDEFTFNVSGLAVPFALKSLDENGLELFALYNGQVDAVEISVATDEALFKSAEIDELFEACEPESEACFEGIDFD